MPVTGAFSTVGFTKGWGRIFLGAGIPASGSVLSLNAAGEPEQGHLLGYTPAGNTITVGYEQEEVNSDSDTETVSVLVKNETLSISGSAMAIEDISGVGQHLMPSGSFHPAASGIEVMNFGGKRIGLTSMQGIMLVWPAKSSPGEWIRFNLYDPQNTAGTNWRVTRTGYAEASYTFLGRAIVSRPAGDQIGMLVKDVPFLAEEE